MPLRIPNSDREHAAKLIQALFTPATIRLEHHFSIGVTSKSNALGFQLVTNLTKVIELTVIDDPVSASLVLHRLVSERR